MTDDPTTTSRLAVVRHHSRHWRENLYVYPVISRRSRGLSIGINLNPDKACNFDCIYCQVDRTTPPAVRHVDLPTLERELREMLSAAADGTLYALPPLSDTPPDLRVLRDVAFSGDGEPTASPAFGAAVEIALRCRDDAGLHDLPVTVLTDAAYLDRPHVVVALERLERAGGQVWAKLDAGTEEYYRLVNRPNVPLQVVLDNITLTARRHPVVIQSLWMRIRGQIPPDAEIDAFARRLADMQARGARFALVQVYTIARRPAEPWVEPLALPELERIASHIARVTDVPLACFA